MHRVVGTYVTTGPSELTDAALLEKYQSLIERIARRMVWRTGMHSAYDDLWSAGALALIEAGHRYDSTKGASFTTFAEYRVRGAMIDELRSMDHLPRRLRSRTDDLTKAKRKLEESLGREPTVDEIAKELDLDMDEMAGIAMLMEPHLPLESVLHRMSTEDDLQNQVLRAESVRRLSTALESLPERLRVVLALHYDEDLTYREIARMLDVSEPRVCQLHADALKKLREVMSADE